MLTRTAILETITVPGCVGSVPRARAFVGSLLGPDDPRGEAARLLVSELVTNAVVHSDSRHPGGTVTVLVTEGEGGLRVEVIDEGSAHTVPVVMDDVLATQGRGLLLVQSLADEWGYFRDSVGTTVWFHLGAGPGRRG
jgi:anti-sigma regulatory factor (Ser/Thr protein kinase)